MIFRNYRLIDKKHYIIEGFTERQGLYNEFLPIYYGENEAPSRVLLDVDTENFETLERWLNEKEDKKVTLLNPKAGEQLKLLQMCLNNAAETFRKNLKEPAEKWLNSTS